MKLIFENMEKKEEKGRKKEILGEGGDRDIIKAIFLDSTYKL